MRKLTAIIPTGNEAHNIAEAIESVRFADEILVVDSFSTDQTVEIAQRAGAKVIQREYGYSASQKNWAIPQAEHEWILLLDADERIPEALQQEIINTLEQEPNHDGYWIYRRNFFLGREVKYSWKDDRVIRLFHRDRCRYEDKHVHAEILAEGSVGELKNSMIHNTYVSIDAYVKKLNRYADWQANDYDKKVGKITAFHLWVKPGFRFFKHYLLKQGFRDGMPGFIIAILQAYAVRMRYIKLWIKRNTESAK